MYETVVFGDCNDIGFVCNMIDDVFADLFSEKGMGGEPKNENKNENDDNEKKKT